MITYRLPQEIQGLLFDMDLTLYRNEDYYRSQIKNQVILLASDLGKPLVELETTIARWQEQFRIDNEGKDASFGNSLLGALGIPIEKSVELRRRAIRPEDYLEADPQLRATLELLRERYKLVLVTNNPSDIASRTLEVLGVSDFFPRIVGLEESGSSKPHPAAFEVAFRELGLPPSCTVSIGDRFPVDLEYPLSRGAGGILVESMEDIYALPGLLLSAGKKS